MWLHPVALFILLLFHGSLLREDFGEMKRVMVNIDIYKMNDDQSGKVSFHVVYPVEFPPRIIRSLLNHSQMSNDEICKHSHKKVLESMLERRPTTMRIWREKLLYPQNLMRNVARHTCPNLFFMCPDVDMLPTSNTMYDDLNYFLQQPKQKKCDKCAYVIPVYELSKNVSMLPTNKTQLIELLRKGLARVFHSTIFYPNQGLSRLSNWERQSESAPLTVSHDAGNYSFWYEPIYVARNNAPIFDERFVGYGFTRNTQVYEMFLSGWKFKVLNNVFLIHWGFQEKHLQGKWRKKQADKNFEFFKDFLREKAVKYDKDPLNMLLLYTKERTKITIAKSNISQ